MCIALLCISLTASAYDFKVDGLCYNVISLQDLTCEVTYDNTEYTGDIVVPSTVEYKSRIFSVTAIGENAFAWCPDITSVILQEGLFSIDKKAFTGCTGLTSVSFPDGLREIKDNAFRDCSNLASVSFSEGLSTIGEYAFENCTRLTSVSFSIGELEIKDKAFRGCENLNHVKFQKGLVSIGKYVFLDCPKLMSVILPDGMTTIGSASFAECTGLKSIILPSSITKIGDKAFYGCTSLSSVIFSQNLNEIGHNAFESCTCLTAISLPNNIQKIGSCVFRNCINLRSIVFEDNDNQVNIDGSIFSGCTSIEWLKLPKSCVVFDNLLPKCNLKYLKMGNICLTSYDKRRNVFFMKNSDVCKIGTMETSNIMRVVLSEYDNTDFEMEFTMNPEVLILNQDYNNNTPQLNVDEKFRHWYRVRISGSGVKKVISKCLEPPTFPCFVSDYQFMHTEVEVPIESLEKYQQAPVWKDFWNLKGVEKFDEIVDGINETESDLIKTEVARYDLTGKAVSEDYRGIVIVRYSDGSTSKMVQR